MNQFTDMIGHKIDLGLFPPKRIISLVPSQTELLYDLGLEEEVVGITKFCIHPDEWFRTKTRVGGTKTLNIDTIKSLHPDLIIANKEENTKEQIELLTPHFPVWTSNINTLEDALIMIQAVGKICDKTINANALITNIEKQFQTITKATSLQTAAYLIWKSPWMTVGSDTFISDIMQRVGYCNVFADFERYPEITIEDLQNKNPQLVLLSSEPYPFKEKHIAYIQEHLPLSKVLLVDGEMFSWYGSRLQYAAEYFKSLQS